MSSHSRRKLVLLFFLAVLLPSLVLTVFTWRMIRQEQELAEKRLADERRRAARELGQLLLARLEKIKLQETGAFLGGARTLESNDYRNPEVVMIGMVDHGRLLLPWETGPKKEEFNRFMENPGFALSIRHAEHAEFASADFAQAADLYRQCVENTQDPFPKGYARLSLARTFSKLGRTKDAVQQYRNLLKLPPAIADEYGIPLSLYAGKSLLEMGIGYADVLELIRTELQRHEWIPPAASYLLRDLAGAIADRASEGQVRSEAGACREDIVGYVSILERILALQRDFQLLGLAATEEGQEDKPEWIAYGSSPWLLGPAPVRDESTVLLLVVEAQSALSSMRSDPAFAEVIQGEINLAAGQAPEGFVPGPGFHNLKVDFAGEPKAAERGWVARRSFYLLALLMVLSVTSFGAYLLWRDVRREVQTAELRSQFVSSVSHELKTPLTAIRMFAETLSLGRTRSPESQKEYLGTIVNESERLTRLLNNVLDFSKIEAGRMAYRLKPTALPDVIHAAARTVQYPLSQQGFSLELEIAKDVPEVQADRDALEQAVLNLLSNAMKYSGDSRSIDLRLAAKEGYAVIQVTDHGVGIDPREQERIFQKFYRVRSQENDRIPGSGLGLALVDHVVRAHGGRITVESTPGEGSTFSIYLPLENRT